MDLSYLKKLIKILDQSNVNEIEIEEEGIKVKLVKSSNSQMPAQAGFTGYPYMTPPQPQIQTEVPKVEERQQPAPAEVKAEEIETKYYEVKSPIVGTFYRAPAPDADPYVEVGQVVELGTVLCIVEAMKLMNEIESDVKGRIVKILVENAQPVEYNQTLFLIEPLS